MHDANREKLISGAASRAYRCLRASPKVCLVPIIIREIFIMISDAASANACAGGPRS